MRKISFISVICLGLLLSGVAQAKPKADKSGTATAPPAQASGTTSEKPKGKEVIPAVSDARVAEILAGLRRTLAKTTKTTGDKLSPGEALLASLGSQALVHIVHAHFTLGTLGRVVKAGDGASADLERMAQTMLVNYQALSKDFKMLAEDKSFEQPLLDIFMSLHLLMQRAATAAEALTNWAHQPENTQAAQNFQSTLEEYRSRAEAFVQAAGH